MSHLYKPTKYTLKQQQNQTTNLLCGIHDIYCFCQHPVKHILLSWAEKGEKIPVTKAEKEKVLQCLSTTEEDIVPEDGFEDGDLEELFAEPLGEDDEG